MTTPSSPLDEIQAAVYALLSADATLDALITGVFDEVPEGTAYPYVVIGEAMELPANAHDRYGHETTVTLHVWSDARGFTEAKQIASRLVTLLDHQPLSVSDHHHVVTRYEFSQALRDPEPRLRHVPIRFRVVTEKLPA